MTDHPIPSPWGRTPRPLVDQQMAADMDDCGEWALDHAPRVGRLDREDIESALRGRCDRGCAGDCHQGRKPCEFMPQPDMSMCDPEHLTPNDGPRARRGGIKRWERVLLNSGALQAAVALAAFSLLIWMAKP